MPRPTIRRTSLTLALAAGVAAVVGATLAGTGMAATGGHATLVDTPLRLAASDPASTADPMAMDGNGSMSGMGSMTGMGSTDPTPMPTGTARRDHDDHRYNRFETTLKDVNGQEVAWIELTALHDGGSLVRVKAWHLTPGFHGFHLHANGICDPAGAKPFASAGGHFNPAGNPEGMQAGAFPVLLAGPDGYASTRFVDGNIVPADLVTATGTAVVIHALPDNYANIPTRYTANGVAGPDQETMQTGDGGGRVACGVLVAPKS
jgi:superoxide dismutase, Cu-Zn family